MLGALPRGLSAQDTLGTVVIVRVHHDAAVVARIRAELEANDFRVHELGPDSNSARAPLASLVSVARARAALRMQPERWAIELWVASDGDAAGGGEVVSLPSDERDEALLAVRATEALRARGLRLPRRAEAAEPAAGGAPIAVAPAVPAVTAAGGTPSTGSASDEERKAAEAAAARSAAEARAREQAERERLEKERLEKERLEKERAAQAAAEQAEADEAEEEDQAEPETSASEAAGPDDASLLYVELGPALAASSGGASPTWAAWANVRVQPSALWSVSALGFVPFAGGTFTRDERTAHMRSVIIGLTADLHGAYRGLELSAGVGGALLLTSIRAESEPGEGFRKNAPNEYTGAALVRLGLQVSLSRRFRISGRGVFGFAIPELEAVVSPEPVTWGQPFVLAAIALEFGLPEPKRP